MAGIQSLMQAPGQAQQVPLPGMMPNQQGVQPGVSALVPSLSGMDIGKLLQMFNDPNSPVPKNRVLAAMDQQQKQMAAQKAVQGQVAMAQAQQQPGTVKDQVVQGALQELRGAQPTQMAAHGGMMHGYAGGGAVAFTNGGPVQKFQYGAGPRGIMAQPPMLTSIDGLPIYAPGPDKAPGETEAEYQARRQREAAEADEVANRPLRRLYRYFAEKVREPSAVAQMRAPAAQQAAQAAQAAQETPAARPDIPRFTSQELERYVKTAAPAPAPAPSAPSGGQRRQPSAAPAPAAPTPPTTATPADLTPELAAALKAQEDRLRGRLTRPESLTKAEEGLAALAKSNIEAQQAEAKTYGEEIRAARDAALARSQRDIMSDPMSLLAIAGAIDTRRGQGAGSLARGISGLMGEREKQAEAARKEFALAQRDERAMQANLRQTQMLEAQRQVALEKGKLDEVNAINDQLSSLAIDREKFRLTRGDVAFQQAMKGREVAAEETKAQAAKLSAGKPTELEQRIRLFQQNPEQYKTMYGIDPKETSVELRALKDEEQQLLKRLEATMLPEARKPIEARLDEIIRMRRTLMGAPAIPAAKTMTMADIQATAASSGRTPEEVRKAAIAAGYTIQ